MPPGYLPTESYSDGWIECLPRLGLTQKNWKMTSVPPMLRNYSARCIFSVRAFSVSRSILSFSHKLKHFINATYPQKVWRWVQDCGECVECLPRGFVLRGNGFSSGGDYNFYWVGTISYGADVQGAGTVPLSKNRCLWIYYSSAWLLPCTKWNLEKTGSG